MLQELTANTKIVTTPIMGGRWGCMTNLWSSLLYNPYQAAQHKHFFFCLCKALYIKKITKNSLQFLIFL